jgi:hypothetical protein
VTTAVEAAAAAVGARSDGIARRSSESQGKGGRLAALFPEGRALGIEAAVIAGLIVLVSFLVYHFTVHKIVNHRPLGGTNVDVSSATSDQSEAAFAIDPADTKRIFGASNDTGLEVVRLYESGDGGTSWTRKGGPAVAGGSCAHGAPSVAFGPHGREYLAFLAAQYCGDSLTPHLVVTTRPTPAARWEPLVRVAAPTWKYGFDDAPRIAVDERSGRVYVAWTRSLSKAEASIVVSSSTDEGKTWSAATPVSTSLQHPHHATLAIAENGDVYIAGIDATLGVWVARSIDGGKTFAAPRAAAALRANPAGGCALTAQDPLPKELTGCAGPDPTVGVGKNRVYVVYSDVAANQTPDVYAVTLDRDLKRISLVQVNPVEKKKTQQFLPAAALDPTTGVLWACWYDTTFDENAHRAWFTCSASHDGRTWSAPLRASSEPTSPSILYGTLGGTGLYAAVAAGRGVAHVFWADGRVIANSADIFTAAIPEKTAFLPEN